MFEKILIANRGEIACRIIKTAKKLGIITVIVYSEADQHSQAVQLADEAYYIGQSTPAESYLNSEKILNVAKQSGAQAIHPGYGFLSESAQFAHACEEAGIIFIGPPASAIEAMGSKSAAKSLMVASNVPVTPGYHGDNQDPAILLAEACKIGFPVLIKAAAGGGGKGMRAVFEEKEFMEALNGAKREAKAGFGDDTILIEKYLLEPRHVEIQIFCDHHGNAVYLFERDCSIQRRHQKVLEEAPAPHLNPDVREAMGKAAIQAAKSIGYVGAGTIEFLLDKNGAFYFMEMNTRLQVEHPVTEMITRQDLVEWQLKVANREPLPLQQKDLKIHGHAIEVRIYAEDPDNQFLPSTGKLIYFETPVQSDSIRVDTGFVQNDTITPYYDPMMAKLIVWGEDRNAAIRHLSRALSQYYVIGVKNNIAFLKQIIQHAAFKEARLSTNFIELHAVDLNLHSHSDELTRRYLTLAYLYEAQSQETCSMARTQDPWNKKDAWQMNQPSQQAFCFHVNNLLKKVILKHLGDTQDTISLHHLDNNQQDTITHYHCESLAISAEIDQKVYSARIFKSTDALHLLTSDGIFTFVYDIPESHYDHQAQSGGQLTAPMPGLVVALHVEKGQSVKAGDRLIVIEAMKMEHTLCAPHAGTVKEIYFPVGQQVNDGDELMAIEEISNG